MENKIRVVELFAGVGGFRLGLEGWGGLSSTSGYTKHFDSPYAVVWSNQFEPRANKQIASQVYQFRWGPIDHVTEDIHTLVTAPTLVIPEHDMIVGGFPCQDYSVANTLRNAKGIEGKKGVLWWDIHAILDRFAKEECEPTKYLMLENVDRLLKSPVRQRGRDFAIMLACLADLGYIVEWRVINAAEYGMPQRRRRVFILAYHESTPIAERARQSSPLEWLNSDGVGATAFPVRSGTSRCVPVEIIGEPYEVTERFNNGRTRYTSPFQNAGLMIGRTAFTTQVVPPELSQSQIEAMALRQFLDMETDLKPFIVPDEIVLDKNKGWAFHKGPKTKKRIDPDTNYPYQWSEGAMSLIDDIDKPARTIITSEGGASPGRSKHLIRPIENGPYRRLTPLELERVSMFPDNHTQWARLSDGAEERVGPGSRAFFIGNAVVVGVIEKFGLALANAIQERSPGSMKELAYEVSM